jgi:hypothetical protein
MLNLKRKFQPLRTCLCSEQLNDEGIVLKRKPYRRWFSAPQCIGAAISCR